MSDLRPHSIGAYDAKTHFSELLERVEGGEEVTITRHGSPVARMVPVRRKSTREQRRAAISAMRTLARGNTLGRLRVKDLIAEGRRVSAAFIIDCSITMAWCFADEATRESGRVLDRLEEEAAVVPAHWFLEVANVLAMAEKRKRLTAAKSGEFLAQLQMLDVEVDDESGGRAFEHLLPLCRAQKLTSYDAAYLDLAVRRRLPLATLDNDLRRGAKALGVEVLGK